MKKHSLADLKKVCQVTPVDMEGWSYQSIVETVESNAKLAFEQGLCTKSVRDRMIEWGVKFADKKHFNL